MDLNQGPTGYEPVALTNCAIGHKQSGACLLEKHRSHQCSLKIFYASLSKKPAQCAGIKNDGAENEARTRDPHLGKVVLYH